MPLERAKGKLKLQIEDAITIKLESEGEAQAWWSSIQPDEGYNHNVEISKQCCFEIKASDYTQKSHSKGFQKISLFIKNWIASL